MSHAPTPVPSFKHPPHTSDAPEADQRPVPPTHQVPALAVFGFLIQFAAVMSAISHVSLLTERTSSGAAMAGSLRWMHLTGLACSVVHWIAGSFLVRRRRQAFTWLLVYLALSMLFLVGWSAACAMSPWKVDSPHRLSGLGYPTNPEEVLGYILPWEDDPLDLGYKFWAMLQSPRPDAFQALRVGQFVWTACLGCMLLTPGVRRALQFTTPRDENTDSDGVGVLSLVFGLATLWWVFPLMVDVKEHWMHWPKEIWAGCFSLLLVSIVRVVMGLWVVLGRNQTVLRIGAWIDFGLTGVLAAVNTLLVILYASPEATSSLYMSVELLAFSISLILFVHRPRMAEQEPSRDEMTVRPMHAATGGVSALGWLLLVTGILSLIHVVGLLFRGESWNSDVDVLATIRDLSDYHTPDPRAYLLTTLALSTAIHFWTAAEILFETSRRYVAMCTYGLFSLVHAIVMTLRWSSPRGEGVLTLKVTHCAHLFVLPILALWLCLRAFRAQRKPNRPSTAV